MFECKSCATLRETLEILKSEVSHLRESNKKYSDQLIAATNMQAFNALTFGSFSAVDQKSYYGSKDDDIEQFDEFGNKYLIPRYGLNEK